MARKLVLLVFEKGLLKGKVEEIPDFLGRPYEVKCDWDGFRLSFIRTILFLHLAAMR